MDILISANEQILSLINNQRDCDTNSRNLLELFEEIQSVREDNSKDEH